MKEIATFIALNRFGLGAAPGDADAVAPDPRGWVKAQIDPAAARGAHLDGFRPSSEILQDLFQARQGGAEGLQKATRAAYRRDFVPHVMARARGMIRSGSPFAERMVAFWSNHFTVSMTKAVLGPAIPAYEREAIRPHVFGRFEDLLRAVARHPVMLAYLDNAVSVGEGSVAGRIRMRRTGAEKTLNENLAREILELHTLGVNGGYMQDDVMELARALSGWSFGGVRLPRDSRPAHGRFEFKPLFHEPGPRTVMGKVYRNDGPDQGLEILRDLARHPATATFIATKLVRHFVADRPPGDDVARIAQVFRDTDGDLAAVSAALIDLPAVWAEPAPKVKTHYELIVAAHRALGTRRLRPRDLYEPLSAMGHVPFTAPSPAGWGDSASDWIAPEALMRRVEWLRGLAARAPRRIVPEAFLDDVIGPVADPALRDWVGRAPSGDAAIALIMASPEFQRR